MHEREIDENFFYDKCCLSRGFMTRANAKRFSFSPTNVPINFHFTMKKNNENFGMYIGNEKISVEKCTTDC